MTDSDKPKSPITVAVTPESELHERLDGILEEVDTSVDRVPLDEVLRNIAKGGPGRVLVIDGAQLPKDPLPYVEELLCEDDAPSLVILSDRSDPHFRAQMLAAGASHVVDAGESNDQLSSTLTSIAEREAAGGDNGPEIRGNSAQPQLSDFISRSRSMQRFVGMVAKVAEVDCSLLITGETGVGKERLARAIHAESSRKGPFVGINCGAMSEALLESQLFGHEAGAFTGARTRHLGYFEQAQGGTVFLDEIGEIPSHLQVKLLTVLQRHEVQRLGSEKPQPVDVRVLAATNRDLPEEVKQRRFREDLYYRLNVIHLRIPPLRDRPEDIPDLAGGLIQFFRCDLVKTQVENISEQALDALLGYRWPGNIRELINVVERAMILSDGPEICLTDLALDIQQEVARQSGARLPGEEPSVAATRELPANWMELSLKDVRESAAQRIERAYLDAALRTTHGRISEVAKLAKIGDRSLYDKMRRHDLRKEDYRPSRRAGSADEPDRGEETIST